MGNGASTENDVNEQLRNDPNTSRSYRSDGDQSETSSHSSPPTRNRDTEHTQLAILGNQTSNSDLIGVDGSFFSSRAPRDAVAGISSGVKSALKGVLGGVMTLIALPVEGARDDGVVGFAKGTVMGLTGAVVLPLTGTAVAVYQISRGIYNTPSAFINANNGLKWNKKTRNWETRYYHLSKDIEKYIENINPYLQYVEQSTDSKLKSDTHTLNENIKVVDYEYYDILQVDASASKDEIKRQYYKLAKQFHPDKNPDNIEAKENFQLLGKAYQVLSNDELRAKYNELGKVGTEDTLNIDMTELFTCLFGSEKLEPLTGKTATVFNIEYNFVMGTNSTITEAFTEFEKNKRLTSIALNLRNLITPYCNIENDEYEKNIWRNDMKAYANDLCAVSFGFTFVEALGWSYINIGTQFLGELDTFLGYGGKYAKVKARWRQYGNKYTTVRTQLNTVVSVAQTHRIMRKKEKSSTKTSNNNNTATDNNNNTATDNNNNTATHNNNNTATHNNNNTATHNNNNTATHNNNNTATHNNNNTAKNTNNIYMEDDEYYTPNDRHDKNSSSSSSSSFRLKFTPKKNKSSSFNSDNHQHRNTTTTNNNNNNTNTSPNNNNTHTHTPPNTPPPSPSMEDSENDMKLLEKLMGNFMEYLLQILIVDLEATSRKSCKRLLRDLDVCVETRRKRAQALIELGEIFQDTAHKWLETNQIRNKTKIDGPAALDLLKDAMTRYTERKNDEKEPNMQSTHTPHSNDFTYSNTHTHTYSNTHTHTYSNTSKNNTSTYTPNYPSSS